MCYDYCRVFSFSLFNSNVSASNCLEHFSCKCPEVHNFCRFVQSEKILGDQKMNKTKKKIQYAFISLLYQKNFYEIRVPQIIDIAEISRSTFYNHFEDKFDVLETISNELIAGFIDIMLRLRKRGERVFFEEITNHYCEPYIDYFIYLNKHKFYFTALLPGTSATNFQELLANKINETRQGTISAWGVETNYDDLEVYRRKILANAYVTIFEEWLKRGCRQSPEVMGIMLTDFWSSPLMVPQFMVTK